MIKRISVLILALALLFLSGCAKKLDLEIKDSSVEITGRNNNTYYSPLSEEDTYCFVEINSKIYIPFGTQSGKITGEMVGECIAYEDSDSNSRYYEVIGNDNFIAAYYVGGVMEQIDFWRAADTIGTDIEIPSFIEELGYDIWKD